MNSLIFLIAFLSMLQSNHTLNIIGISKVICHFRRFGYAEFLRSEKIIVNISKTLFKQCGTKVRIVSHLTELQSDFIWFTMDENNKKERF